MARALSVNTDRVLAVLAALLVAAGFLLRLHAASGIRLSGDEALHWALFHQPDAALMYERTLQHAHPPLYFAFLYAWHRFGTSELFLRLPSVVFGSLLAWQVWRFVATILDRRAALVATALVALSPSLIALSAEVRGYGMFLFFAMAALAALEPALTEATPKKLALFCVPLFLAVLTHYSALWLAIAMAIYSIVRLRGAPPKTIRRWVLLWGSVAAVYGLLFFSQVRILHGGRLETEAIETWLSTSYFQEGRDQLLTWIPLRTQELGWWLSGLQPPWGARLGWVIAAAFLLGCASMALRRRPAVLLLVLPFLLAGAASILHLYPFGGTRHSAFLAPLLASGVGALVAEIGGRRPWFAVLVAAATGILPWSRNSHPGTRELRERLAIRHVAETLDYAREVVPEDAVICVDQQTRLTLEYYAMRGEYVALPKAPNGFFERRLHGRRMVSATTWRDDPASFHATLDRLSRVYGVPQGGTVWVINIGPDKNLAFKLSASDGPDSLIAPRAFGFCASVFGFRVP